jgi:hypothetical protein
MSKRNTGDLLEFKVENMIEIIWDLIQDKETLEGMGDLHSYCYDLRDISKDLMITIFTNKMMKFIDQHIDIIEISKLNLQENNTLSIVKYLNYLRKIGVNLSY